MAELKLVLGSDHAGYVLRSKIAAHLSHLGHLVQEVGASSEQSYDYPRASDQVCRSVLNGDSELGILICGSGIGVSIRANRYSGIRAANCCSEEMAQLARNHNHANVLCLGSRLLSPDEATRIVESFLESQPDEDERHERRVDQLDSELSVSK